ncbi:hypothetical protein Zmor_024373 [Zophobas morio]|uniref:Uncharacterized protein n=1 Tax=Zophobas morio TaxID=2755281 RepID=A0AA38I063_9CUCU|nr:hypothetical protein Zmor_024373 [Zophobas morio]
MQHLRDDHSSEAMSQLIQDIKNNKVEDFKKRLPKAAIWNVGRTISLPELVLETINCNRKEIFDYLLQDCHCCIAGGLMVPNYFGKTILEVAGERKNDITHYYVRELIKHTLHLEKTIEIALNNSSRYIDEEHIATLLCYAADLPDAFDRIVLFGLPSFIQDAVFFYVFDEFPNHKVMQFKVLLTLAGINNFLFHKVLEYGFEFRMPVTYTPESDKREFGDLLISLFYLENHHLEILLGKCASEICQIFKKCAFHSSILVKEYSMCEYLCSASRNTPQYNILYQYTCESMFSIKQTIDRLTLFLENDIVNPYLIGLIEILDSIDLFCLISQTNNESTTTEIFIYLLMYGLRVKVKLLDIVYNRYGYCELFKLLLHMDIEEPDPTNLRTHSFYEYVFDLEDTSRVNIQLKNSLLNFILDINFDVEKLPEQFRCYNNKRIQHLLDYFAHPKVYELISKYAERRKLSSDTLRKIENHPQVPLLMEMARDIFRKYFRESFQITTTKMLYSFINGLPIAATHRKIITFETKLYHI